MLYLYKTYVSYDSSLIATVYYFNKMRHKTHCMKMQFDLNLFYVSNKPQ